MTLLLKTVEPAKHVNIFTATNQTVGGVLGVNITEGHAIKNKVVFTNVEHFVKHGLYILPKTLGTGVQVKLPSGEHDITHKYTQITELAGH